MLLRVAALTAFIVFTVLQLVEIDLFDGTVIIHYLQKALGEGLG